MEAGLSQVGDRGTGRLRSIFALYNQFATIVLFSMVAGGCALPTGLTRSRWAMDAPEYAEKYCDGAEKTDVAGKLKQAVDARFQKGAGGYFVSGGLMSRPGARSELAGIDFGFEGYATSYLTSRCSLMLMTDGDDWFTGADAGVRVQTPTRLAPFAGLGLFAGYAKEVVPADDDWIDNDDDGFVDEWGEDRERFSDFLASVYPETGVHFWWTPNIRLSGFGRYMITTEGRDDDDWLIGGGIALFTR